MIRLIQRKLIIPRGDTGSFSVPTIASATNSDVAVFTIFDCLTHTKVFEQETHLNNGQFTINFSHNDTVNLPCGKYYWDIKFYKNPVYADDHLINGDEVDSYYAGYNLAECEIRPTGDNLLISPDAPSGTLTPEQLDIINAAVTETQTNVTHYPYVGEDNYWYVWDAVTNQFVNTSTSAVGPGIAAGGTTGNVLLKKSDVDYDTEWGEIDITVKADKVNNATEGDIATLDATGNLVDSGHTLSEYAPKANPVFSGSISLGRKQDSVVGTNSVAIGNNVEATGTNSVAEGSNSLSLNTDSHAEGKNTMAVGEYSHTEGSQSTAGGYAAHAEGSLTSAFGDCSHSEGGGIWNSCHLTGAENATTYTYGENEASRFQVGIFVIGPHKVAQVTTIDTINNTITLDATLGEALDNTSCRLCYTYALGDYSHVEGLGTTAYTNHQHVQGKHNVVDTNGTYADIVGNGTNSQHRSNAFALSWTGDGKFAGDLYVHANADSTGGYKVATIDNIPSITGKADIVANAVEGNFAGLDSTGNLTDSGKKPSDFILSSTKGAVNGVAELGSDGKVPSAQLPSYVDDVVEYASEANFPATGESEKIYVALDTNLTYRWSGSAYVEISPSLALGETSSTAYRGDYGATAYTHAVTNKGTNYASGLYKITTNSEGHVTNAAAVEKSDITILGIPAQDTTYESKSAINGGTDVSLVTTGEKYGWNSKVDDVQVNGTSIVSNGVANVPIADKTLGAVKVDSGYGIAINSSGRIYMAGASEGTIKSGSNTFDSIIPARQHASVFYGLTKAAGVDMASSNNAVGTYTDAAKAAIQHMIGTDAAIAPYESDITADQAYAQNETFMMDGKLYKASSTIAQGDILTPGTNCTETKVSETYVMKVDAANTYATKTDTVLNTTLSRGRKPNTTIGNISLAFGDTVEASSFGSIALGYNTKASGLASHAEGYQTTASGEYAFTEGGYTTASGQAAHAEGINSIASGQTSHAEGRNNTASGISSHAEGAYNEVSGSYGHVEGFMHIALGNCKHVAGVYNNEDMWQLSPEWTANTQYEVGDHVKITTTNNGIITVSGYKCKVANNDADFNISNWDTDNARSFIEQIGNGGINNRSNARALDWSGNEYLTGDIYVHCNADSTNGIKMPYDVQVNGTSILDNGVANIPIANSSGTVPLGLVKPMAELGTAVAVNGGLAVVKAYSSQTKKGTHDYVAIVPSNEHEATFYGLAKAAGDTTQSQSNNSVGTYTDDAKTKIHRMLGTDGRGELIANYTTTEDLTTITVNTDIDGNSFELVKGLIYIKYGATTTGAKSYFLANLTTIDETSRNPDTYDLPTFQTSSANDSVTFFEFEIWGGGLTHISGSHNTIGFNQSTSSCEQYFQNKSPRCATGITINQYNANNSLIPSGTIIKIWGIRA